VVPEKILTNKSGTSMRPFLPALALAGMTAAVSFAAAPYRAGRAGHEVGFDEFRHAHRRRRHGRDAERPGCERNRRAEYRSRQARMDEKIDSKT
jgi:hypothetical protein